MEIKDLSWNEVISKRFNHPLLPRSIRGIIVGKSGSSVYLRTLGQPFLPIFAHFYPIFS